MAKILVVDDELIICDLLRAVFSRRGHEVVVTTDPRQAAALYGEHRPAITLLDLHMPGLDGIEVFKQIRAIDPAAPVMVLTSGGSEPMERQARFLGVTDFLRKGVSLDVLVGALDRAMRPAAAFPAAAGRAQAAESAAEAQGRPLVLVVDDEEMVRNLLNQYLTLKGYQVRLAQDGKDALAQVAMEPPRMVILDMYMPGMNGVEVLRQLRAGNYHGGVVALTASQDEDLLQQALDLGSVDVMGKPVDLDRLDLVIQVGLSLTES